MAPLLPTQSSRTEEERKQIRQSLQQKHDSKRPFHVKWVQFMGSEAKNHIVAMVGEFIGTFLFLWFAFAATAVANLGAKDARPEDSSNSAVADFNIGALLYVSLAFGLSLVVNAWVFFRISGGLFNPAVTLALALLKEITPFRAILLCIVQCGAACFSAFIGNIMFPTPFKVQASLSATTSSAQGLFIEAICTAELVFAIIMLAKEKHRATFIAPIGIGLALFIGELASVYFTGGALNPARWLGPAVVGRKFVRSDWIYWVGPAIGSILAVLFFKLFKVMEYELVNPGQDGDFSNDPTQNPDHELARVADTRQAEVEELRAIRSEGGFQNNDTRSLDSGVYRNRLGSSSTAYTTGPNGYPKDLEANVQGVKSREQ